MKTKSFLNITFFHEYISLSFPHNSLKSTVEKLYNKWKATRHKGVNVIFCSDYRIRKLNRTYRNKDRTTDVLSFPFTDEDFLGEIYISLQRAAVQARRFHLSYAEEVNRLFVHGFFHLLGFDHTTEKERNLMESHEKRYY